MISIKNGIFTFQAYKDLLICLLENGYEFASYADHSICGKPCILRHDVDYSLQKSAQLSSLEADFAKEAKERCFSTYFVSVTSPFYNIHAKSSRAALDSILADGNDIGLHFDPTVYDIKDQETLIEYAEKEAFLLGKTLGRTILSVSVHKPAGELLHTDVRFHTLTNAYSHTFFEVFKYISDSSMRWREDPFDTIRTV